MDQDTQSLTYARQVLYHSATFSALGFLRQSCFVTHAGLKLVIHLRLPLPPECWDDSFVSPCLA
jgi:hypothetical protein